MTKTAQRKEGRLRICICIWGVKMVNVAPSTDSLSSRYTSRIRYRHLMARPVALDRYLNLSIPEVEICPEEFIVWLRSRSAAYAVSANEGFTKRLRRLQFLLVRSISACYCIQSCADAVVAGNISI